ncbi:HAD family hydrolase [Alteromonas profundi]|uniref:HAD family hydrolase n=1 Tax=Alteromonas profundi TaxID=2696062 RepID=UPI0031B58B65
MSEIKLVIFDCDGVLLDSECMSMQLWQTVLQEVGITLSKAYFVANFLGKSMQHVEQQVSKDFGLVLTPDMIADYHRRLEQNFTRDLCATPGIKAILESIAVPYCLATSSSKERTTHALSCTGLSHYFIEKQFTRSMVNRGKPAPDLFLLAAKTMGVAPQNCLVIEDSQAGIEAAKAANMQVAHYIGGSHLDVSNNTDLIVIRHWRSFSAQFPNLITL